MQPVSNLGIDPAVQPKLSMDGLTPLPIQSMNNVPNVQPLSNIDNGPNVQPLLSINNGHMVQPWATVGAYYGHFDYIDNPLQGIIFSI